MYMYEEDLALNNLQWLIYHKPKPNQTINKITLFTFRPKDEFVSLKHAILQKIREQKTPGLKNKDSLKIISTPWNNSTKNLAKQLLYFVKAKETFLCFVKSILPLSTTTVTPFVLFIFS